MAKTPPAPAPVRTPAFPGHFMAPDALTQDVLLMGGGALDGTYAMALPIPQTLSHGTITYDLSIREAGVYAWRHR